MNLMKKYLNILAAVLISALSVSLASCGDDDEPDGGNKNKGVVGELTIDGQKKSFYYITGETSDDSGVKYTAMMYTKGWEDVISFQTLLSIDDLTSGMTLTDDVAILQPIFANTLESGNIHVDKKTEDSITLTFNKAVFKEFNGNKTSIYEGTIKLPIDGEYGDALSSMW